MTAQWGQTSPSANHGQVRKTLHTPDIHALWFDRTEYESLLFISRLNWAWACTDTRNQTQGELLGFTRKISSVCILHHISLSKQPDTQTVIPTSDTGKINFKKAKWPTQKSYSYLLEKRKLNTCLTSPGSWPLQSHLSVSVLSPRMADNMCRHTGNPAGCNKNEPGG